MIVLRQNVQNEGLMIGLLEHMTIALLFIACFFSLNINGEVFSCGGFVKTSNIAVDFSSLQVKLFTSEGNLKGEAECSPTNGYYMIPVYNKGGYTLRIFAPDGWFFTSDSVEIKVDGKTDPCSKGEDINFVLSAFAVKGVLRSGSGGGPSGIVLTMSAEDGSVIAKTKTAVNGEYTFKAPPGNYLVSTASDSSECIERGKVPVSVKSSPVYVDPDLKISGHLLTVEVSSKKLRVAGVIVSLYSNVKVKVPYCSASLEITDHKMDTSLDDEIICVLKTDVLGIARFPCLPPGSYKIIPSLSMNKVHFTFSPNVTLLEMMSSAKKVEFKMLGFSGRGRVLMGGKPVAGANIIVNGDNKEASDENGWYSLDGLQNEEYAIQVTKKHYYFDSVVVKMDFERAEIPDIDAKGVEICVVTDVEGASNKRLPIVFTNKETGAIDSFNTNEAGVLCAMLSPGKYLIAVGTESRIVMTPMQYEVDSFLGPINNVKFSQFKANVTIDVKCLDFCDSLKVEMWKKDKLVASEDGSTHFVFSGISPDFYKVKIVDGGRFCWKNSEFNVVVERSNLNNLLFEQIGYRAAFKLSNAAEAVWSLLNNPSVHGSVHAASGLTAICVPMVGTYNIKFDACHKFDKASYELIVPQKMLIVASAIKFAASASINLENNNNGKEFHMIVRSQNEEQNILAEAVKPGQFIFHFYISAVDIGTVVVLIPQSTNYLFYPTSHVIQFNGECHFNEITFEAKKGVFLDGQILPPVINVNITAQHKTDRSHIFQSLTDENGHFKLGPMRTIDDFDLSAEKDGYKFEKTDKVGMLHAVKLSQLIITAFDIETNKSLPNVLLSLSGGNEYRSNSLIDETGAINFVGLRPGEYFVRPVLQEYQFEPRSLRITIQEGDFKTVKLAGRRFAYSVYGKVTYLNGQPASLVVVEAVSEQCSNLQEEDITIENGNYRIRGLHPKCSYRLVLKSAEGHRLQSYPVHCDVMVNMEDIYSIDFVLTHIDENVDVAGEAIFINTKSPSQYKIVLYKRGNVVQHVVLNAPSNVFFFDILGVDNAEYSVRFEAIQSSNGHKFDSTETFFIANDTFKSIQLIVRQKKKSDVEISKGSYLSLPFFFLVAYVFFNQQKVCSIIESILARISNISLLQRNSLLIEDSSSESRKRHKTKKTL